MSSFGVLNGVVLNGTANSPFIACEPASAKAEASAQEPTRIRLAYGDAAVAKAEPPAGEGYVNRRMVPKTVQGRALSFNNAGDTTILEVVLRYVTGTAISRAQSRGVHSVFFAESSDEANAETGIRDDATYRSRRVFGQPVQAKAIAYGEIKQGFSVESKSTASAEASISPSIYYGGGSAKTAFGWGSVSARAKAGPVTAVRNPFLIGQFQVSEAISSAIPVPKFDVNGTNQAKALASGVESRIRVNRLIWPVLDASSGAAFINTAGVKHLNAFTGIASATCKADDAVATRITKADGVISATASVDDQAYKEAYTSGQAQSDGTTLIDAAVTLARRVSGTAEAYSDTSVFNVSKIASLQATSQAQAQTAADGRNAAVAISLNVLEAFSQSYGEGRNATVAAGADNAEGVGQVSLGWVESRYKQGLRILRRVGAPPGTATANANTGRNVFKINAGEPAPDRRTIELPDISRNFTIPYASREYRV